MEIESSISKLKLMGERDRLFLSNRYPQPFEFNNEVARVFDDMVQRSIPLYSLVTDSACKWASQYYQKGSAIYDIGCSTGTTIDALSHVILTPSHFIGIDNSEAMISKAEEKLHNFTHPHKIDLICDDVLNVEFKDLSVAIVNYTLQFIPIAKRKTLLKKIYNGMRDGGLLFISEKVASSCPRFQETKTEIYENFKASQGYSNREIARKKEALENVLVPFTESQLVNTIEQVGFSSCESVIKWNNFTSLIALKESGNEH